jgi:hypothetical protein
MCRGDCPTTLNRRDAGTPFAVTDFAVTEEGAKETLQGGQS